MPSHFRAGTAWTTVGIVLFLSAALQAADTTGAAQPSPGTELFSNPDFSKSTQDPAWPDDWRRKPWVTWQTEKEAHFLRFIPPEPRKDFTLWRDLAVPPEAKAMELTIRYRTHDLKIDAQKNAGAGASITFFDAVRIKFSPAPDPLNLSSGTTDWTESSVKFKVPHDAVSLTLDFGLNQVDSGTLDIAKVSLKSVTPSAVPTVAPVEASDAVPIRREGPRTIFGAGKPTVWFIHPYVDVLGHDFDMGISNLVWEAREKGLSLAVGVTGSLHEINTADEANTTYVFTYKNINYALPENAHRLIFFNTWLTPSVSWPATRAGKRDVVMLGSKTLHNNGDGLATNKDRWWQIQKDDPGLALTVLDSTGYYLPIAVWRSALLKILLEDSSK